MELVILLKKWIYLKKIDNLHFVKNTLNINIKEHCISTTGHIGAIKLFIGYSGFREYSGKVLIF